MMRGRAQKSAAPWIALLAVVSVVAALGGQSTDPVVSVSGGQVRGASLAGGGAVFKGIPYAAPPVGDLRWRESQPVRPWSGIRDATAFGAPCPQLASQRARVTGNTKGQSAEERSKEDCLFLNVWTPAWPVRSRLPVIMWIHGGGHVSGEASDDLEGLARYGVVGVSIHYRVGQLGFLAHPELTRESPHRSSGNYGLLDQVAALGWVRDHIVRFGGDAANVTVDGHSTGANDISMLMTSPLAKGLFHRATVRSGPILSAIRTLGEAERDGEALAAGVKAPVGSSLSHLRNLTVSEILNASPNWTPGRFPVVDGYVLPASPAIEFAHGRQHAVAMIIGSAARDYPLAWLGAPDIPALSQAYGPLSERAITLYGAARPESWTSDPSLGSPAEQWSTDRTFRCGAVQYAIWHAQAGHPVYQYQFSRLVTSDRGHGVDTRYLFGALDPGAGDVDRTVSEGMQTYWTNFAKHGDPNRGTLVSWPRFDASRRAFLEFTDRGPVVGEGLRRAYCDLHIENVKRLMSR